MIERIGLKDSIVTVKYGDGQKYENTQDVKDHEAAIHLMLKELISLKIIADYNEITVLVTGRCRW